MVDQDVDMDIQLNDEMSNQEVTELLQSAHDLLKRALKHSGPD